MEAVRQEFVDLLRDKRSKMSFLLENSMIKQEIDRLKHNEEVLKHEIELFKNKTASPPAENYSLHVFELKGQQDLIRQDLKQHEQVFKNALKTLKRQWKLKLEEAACKSKSAALRKELIEDMVHHKQEEMTSKLDSMPTQQEIKQDEEALKQEIGGLCCE